MRTVLTVLAVGLLAAARIEAQTVPLTDLVKQLRQGGYVLVMRHASSPREVPTKETANADNTKLERQLDEAGRRGAAAMGEAIRALRIPIGARKQDQPSGKGTLRNLQNLHRRFKSARRLQSRHVNSGDEYEILRCPARYAQQVRVQRRNRMRPNGIVRRA